MLCEAEGAGGPRARAWILVELDAQTDLAEGYPSASGFRLQHGKQYRDCIAGVGEYAKSSRL
jgi:hypothetical protein